MEIELTDDDAKNSLVTCKEAILISKLATARPDKINIDADCILQPSNSKHWGKIKFYKTMINKVKTAFREKQGTEFLQLTKGGPTGFGTTIGQDWDDFLTMYINGGDINKLKEVGEEINKLKEVEEEINKLKEVEEEINKLKEVKEKINKLKKDGEEINKLKEVAEAMEYALQNKFNGLKLLVGKFPLYGYMHDKAKSKVYLWQGEADAVAVYDHKYVIVDWKVLDALNYWLNDKRAFGAHLHQCLVYARLLQLHLELDYLPYILIVPINKFTGKDIHPGLFTDYPEDCKDLLNQFDWSTKMPDCPLEIAKGSYLLKPVPPAQVGKVIDPDTLLTDLFRDNAKVQDLIKALRLPALKIVED